MKLSPSRRQILQWQMALPLASLAGCGMGAGHKNKPAPGSAKAAGYRMPHESAPHERTFMQWPISPSIYGSKAALDEVRKSVALIARKIAKFEPVVMLGPKVEAKLIREMTKDAVEHWPIMTNDLWCRDSGPNFVQNADGSLAVANLNFNGWGKKQHFGHDGAIAEKISQRMDVPLFATPVIGEGGGVESDGAGTLIAHESSWLHKRRNRESRQTVGKHLIDALGGDKMIWAPGLAGQDMTDYHIDSLARFVRPGVVMIQLPKKISAYDPWSKVAYETYEILKKAKDANGDALELVIVPEPVDIRSPREDFVSSYVNYYVCNGAVIAAQFGDDEADTQALATLQFLYPEREIVMINIDPIAEAGGGVHCATQQQPARNV